MHRTRNGERWHGVHQRAAYPLIVLLSVLLLGLQCRSSQAPVEPEGPEALFNRIEHLFLTGELARADAEGRRILGLAPSTQSEWRDRLRLQHAEVRLYEGRANEALPLLQAAKLDPSASHATFAKRDTLLSVAYSRTGDAVHAEQSLSEARRYCDDDLSQANISMAQGVISLDHGRYEEAEGAFEHGRAAFEALDKPLFQAYALLNLGVIALRQEHYEDARNRFDHASALAGELHNRLLGEKATGNIGSTLQKMGDFEAAFNKSKAAEEEASAIGSPIDQGGWLEDMGLSQYRLGDFKGARISFDKAYKLALEIKNSEAIVDEDVALGFLSLESGDYRSALAQADDATRVASTRDNEGGMFQPLLLEARILARAGQSGEAQSKLLALELRCANKPSVRWEVESSLAALSSQAGNGREADAWFQRAIDTFDRQRSSFRKVESKLPFLENGSDLYLGYMEQLIREGRTGEALRILDKSRAETLAEGLGRRKEKGSPAKAVQPSALAERLGGTVLVYSLGKDTSYLWAISPKQSAFFRLPGKAAILSLVDRYQTAILHDEDVLANPATPGRALYDQLVAPAQSLIAGGGGKVFIIGDQGLHRLNFETLLVPTSVGPSHFWIEDATITSAASLSVLAARAAPVKRQSRSLLLIGDPTNGSGGKVELANASSEVASIAGQFPLAQRRVLTGEQAYPAAYEASDPEHFAYIHFVAHGTASEQNPLDSAVILSPQPGQPNAYKLYARSIIDRHISADLVTISTCYGSGSRAYAGEGLVGLAWAFLRAGSHNVIGALWEISDNSTPELMGNMYSQLGKGAAPDVALRSAKLAMLHQNGVFRKPVYWAPFQLYAGA